MEGRHHWRHAGPGAFWFSVLRGVQAGAKGRLRPSLTFPSSGLASAQALVKGSTPPKGYGLGKGMKEAIASGPCCSRS